jgi:hypothetical protein
VLQESLETRVGRLEDDAPLSLDCVDLTVRNPARLRRKFDEIFTYIARVEGSVPQNVADIIALIPDLDEVDRRFLAVWSGHELAHAATFEALRAELGLAPPPIAPAPEASTVPPRPRTSFRIFGTAASLPWLADVFKLVYLARGAMHEHLTYDCYRQLGAQLSDLGEHALATTVCDPIRRQEAAHLGYYRLAASSQRRRLSALQMALARSISIRTYSPVGAASCGPERAGRVFAGLAGERRDEALDAVQSLADQLLGDVGRPLPPFVHDVMDHCLEPPTRRSATIRSVEGRSPLPTGSVGP